MIAAQQQFAVSKFSNIDGDSGTRIGLAQYSSNVYPYWGLDSLGSIPEVAAAFNGLYWRAGSTSTGQAIAYGQQQLMTGQGSRPDAHKLMVLVTDGEPSNRDLALTEANNTRNNGTYLFIMGYGPEVNQPSSRETLLAMVDDPIDLLTVNNVSEYTSAAYLIRLERDYKDHLCFRPPPTVAPTVAPTPDPRHPCLNKSIDFFFLLDTSTSIEDGSAIDLNLFTDPNVSRGVYNGSYTDLPGYTGSTPNYNNVINTLKNFTNQMNVGSESADASKVGMAQWSNYPIPEWGLNNYSAAGQKPDLLSAFDTLKWRGGSTYADRAIEYGVQQLQTYGRAPSDGHYQVLVLVTDGVASDLAKAKATAKQARDLGILVYVLGYGAELGSAFIAAQMEELTGSTNSTQRFFHVEKSEELWRAVDSSIDTMCADLTLPPTLAPTPAPTAIPTMPVSCTNGRQDGTESDVDCGGLMCEKCNSGQQCEGPTDCLINACEMRSSDLKRVCSSAAPTPSPTTSPTLGPTPAPSVYPTRNCYDQEIDWYFVLDSSSSIEEGADDALFDNYNVSENLLGTIDPGYSGSAANYAAVVGELKVLASEMSIGTGGINVGMVQFGSHPIPEWELTDYNSSAHKLDLLAAFDQLSWRGGSTYTDTAIDYARVQLTGPKARPGALKVMYVVTDGKATDFNKTIAASLAAREAGIVMYIVGYGPAVMLDEARVHFEYYAGSADQFARVPTAQLIKQAIDNGTDYMCSFLSHAPTAAPTASPTITPTFLGDCFNGVKDDQETDVDCGRMCAKCEYDKSCETNTDCISNMCGGSKCLSASPTPVPTKVPSAAPSPMPTSTPTVYPTWECSSHGKIDWFFLLDSSSSIEKNHLDNGKLACSGDNPLFDAANGYQGNTTNFAGVVSSMKRQASALKIGPEEVMVGLAQFSTEPMPEWDLSTYATASSKPDLLAAFDSLHYRCGGTLTGEAIKYGQGQLTSGPGQRELANKVLCVVTDGVANDNAAAQREAEYAKGNGTIIYVIGYGDEVHSNVAAQTALRQMATSGDFFFSAEDASGIQAALDNATEHFCKKAFSSAPSAIPTFAPSQAPSYPTSCANGARDGTETDLDCGGPSCGRCAGGLVCDTKNDCLTDLCVNQRCVQPPSSTPTAAPTTELEGKCSNGVRNANTESDIDCGGVCTQKCTLGKNCETADDCISGYCNVATQTCTIATPAPTPAYVGYVTTTTVSLQGFTSAAAFDDAKPSFKTTIAVLYGVNEANIINLEVSDTPFKDDDDARMLGGGSARMLAGEKIYVRFDVRSETAIGAQAVASKADNVFTDADSFEATFKDTMTTNSLVPPSVAMAPTKESVSELQYTAPPTMEPTRQPTAAAFTADNRSLWEKEKRWLLPAILGFSGLVVVLVVAMLLCKKRKPSRQKPTKLEADFRSRSPVKSRDPVKGPQLVDALGAGSPYGNSQYDQYSPQKHSPFGNDQSANQSNGGGNMQPDPYGYYSNKQNSQSRNEVAIGNGGMSPSQLQDQLSKIEDEIRMLNQQEHQVQSTSKDRAMSPIMNRSPPQQHNHSMRTPSRQFDSGYGRSPQQQQQQWQPRSEPPTRRAQQPPMYPGGGDRQVGQHWQQERQQRGGYSLNGINSQDV
jgi:Mg-chelatase subunit ChlD